MMFDEKECYKCTKCGGIGFYIVSGYVSCIKCDHSTSSEVKPAQPVMRFSPQQTTMRYGIMEK